MADVGERMPKAQEMRTRAAIFVQRVGRRGRLPLDYSVASLRVADFLLDGLRRSGAEGARGGEVLLDLGAYVGEVLVRRAGATWIDFDADQQAYFGQPVGVRMPDGRVWNPLGKVRNCFAAGSAQESLRTFYLTLHGRARGRRPVA
ncbi:hypothetical protein ABZT26_38335 [Streptomyces sp. NPDC005395]|uniref:hypothetical protein n=1 Tax=unclassified Streptomyces TaxID=2593676 RepID=UPI0013CAA1F4|nr:MULTISPECIES: hypothetical protein [unclassified Streptomyces]NDZ72053.1 hypothetical protein [Streptomyces sp. SID10362]QUW90871.1 hypothetical protein KE639_02063 [Streptomyces sp. V17-9]WKX21455.1 hypothetical protein Q3Y68_26800 [Streptomyces sp. HUAS CX7]